MLSQSVSVAGTQTSLEHMTATAHAYQQFYGWPTGVDHETGQVVLTVSSAVSAIITPKGIGDEVQSLLSVRMLAGPVVVLPGPLPECVFLTGPACALGPATLGELGQVGVRLNKPGSTVPLPPSHTEGGAVRWLSGPKPTRQLPPWTSVIGTLRTVAALCPT